MGSGQPGHLAEIRVPFLQKSPLTLFTFFGSIKKVGGLAGQLLQTSHAIGFSIEGRLQTTEWTGQDNVKRYRTEIVAENMIMLDTKQQSGERTSAPTPDHSDPANFEDPNWKEPEGDEEIRVEDIPF